MRTLHGRSAIITGASRGLGLAIAQAFVAAGSNVLLCARDEGALARAQDTLQSHAGSGQIVAFEAADVTRLDDVERLVGRALALFGRIEILVNNAGVYGPMGALEDVSWEEWARAIEINIHGSVLPCRAILPHFKQRRYGKIVQLSGGGATSPFPRITAYGASKAAIVRFVESLALEVRDCGIDVNALAPGALNTRMLDEVLDAGPARVGQAYYDRMVRIKNEGGTPLDVGAALAVLSASADSDGLTGRLISAAWDPWETLPARRAEIEGTDIYTLRRIVPADRGRSWGER